MTYLERLAAKTEGRWHIIPPLTKTHHGTVVAIADRRAEVYAKDGITVIETVADLVSFHVALNNKGMVSAAMRLKFYPKKVAGKHHVNLGFAFFDPFYEKALVQRFYELTSGRAAARVSGWFKTENAAAGDGIMLPLVGLAIGQLNDNPMMFFNTTKLHGANKILEWLVGAKTLTQAYNASFKQTLGVQYVDSAELKESIQPAVAILKEIITPVWEKAYGEFTKNVTPVVK